MTEIYPRCENLGHPMGMALDDRTSKQRLSPEARRDYLRGLADRMLLKVARLDDPEDLAGIERTVRVAAVIERIYRACDRAETQTPDPRKLEAERAGNAKTAIKARVELAGTLEWEDGRRKQLGKWWDAADTSVAVVEPVVVPAVPETVAEPEAGHAEAGHSDPIDVLDEVQAEPETLSPTESAERAQYYAWCLESAKAELAMLSADGKPEPPS